MVGSRISCAKYGAPIFGALSLVAALFFRFDILDGVCFLRSGFFDATCFLRLAILDSCGCGFEFYFGLGEIEDVDVVDGF